jgi:hypothetical protein
MRTYIVKIWLKRFISMVEVQDRDAAKDLVCARMAAQRIYLKQSLLKFGHQCTLFMIPAAMLWQTRI